MLSRAQIFFSKVKYGVENIESMISYSLGIQQHPPFDCSITINDTTINVSDQTNKVSLEELFDTSILWAVPKSRRTLEKRMERKFGWSKERGGFWKPLMPRTDLATCNNCGYTYQKKHLCANCYTKVKEETTKLQDKIIAALGLNPVDKEVVVLYKGEKEEASDSFHKNVKVIEMETERPPWFSKNLLQKTTQKQSDATDVKPTELG